MALAVTQIPVGGFDKNFAYLIIDDASKKALVVDPSGDLDALLTAIEKSDCDVVGIVLTHTHADHIDQLAELLNVYLVPLYVHEAGQEGIVSPGPIHTLADNDTVPLGEHVITVLHTPGHADDAVCFYIKADAAASKAPLLITGDTLFVAGCGRTDHTRVKELYNSLTELKTLPPETTIFPGHDYGPTPTSTLKHELQHNRFYQVSDLAAFTKERL